MKRLSLIQCGFLSQVYTGLNICSISNFIRWVTFQLCNRHFGVMGLFVEGIVKTFEKYSASGIGNYLDEISSSCYSGFIFENYLRNTKNDPLHFKILWTQKYTQVLHPTNDPMYQSFASFSLMSDQPVTWNVDFCGLAVIPIRTEKYQYIMRTNSLDLFIIPCVTSLSYQYRNQ